MSNQIITTNSNTASIVEDAIIGGDLSKLTPQQRVSYYMEVCKSVGLNPLTKPFDYITLNGKLTLYARKDASEQLRRINNISIGKPDIAFQDDWIIVTVVAHDDKGRTDSDVGVVGRKDMQGNFGNALMKAITKAKRRVTLSICGLGWLDETEVETIPGARPVIVEPTGEIVHRDSEEIIEELGYDPVPEQEQVNNKPDEKAWEAYFKLVEKAAEAGIIHPPMPNDDVTVDELRKYYGNLQAEIKALAKK